MAQPWYRVEEIAPGTYQITEGGRWKMFLLLGGEKALAVDGGVGIGNYRALCESLTRLPLEHILTHTHWDHIGAAHQWESAGVHPNGRDRLAVDYTEVCRNLIATWGDGLPFPGEFDPGTFTIPPATPGRDVKEGDVFDLGGRRIRVYDTPGHSPCSVSLLDEKEGVLITGDLVKPFQPLYLQVPTAVLSDYGPSLRKLETIASEVKWVCSGHTDAFSDASIIGEMAEAIERIQENTYDPPRKLKTPGFGVVDAYMGTRFSVWINDHARK
ncbi:MAG: MBL fold metallo-hydrolase [bacterium]|nr:MBL fold metallo-hydrolase [bacterium]